MLGHKLSVTLFKGIMWAKECLYLRYRGERQGEGHCLEVTLLTTYFGD